MKNEHTEENSEIPKIQRVTKSKYVEVLARCNIREAGNGWTWQGDGKSHVAVKVGAASYDWGPWGWGWG